MVRNPFRSAQLLSVGGLRVLVSGLALVGSELFRNHSGFRNVELAKMKPVDPPASWGGGGAVTFDSGLTYEIPD